MFQRAMGALSLSSNNNIPFLRRASDSYTNRRAASVTTAAGGDTTSHRESADNSTDDGFEMGEQQQQQQQQHRSHRSGGNNDGLRGTMTDRTATESSSTAGGGGGDTKNDAEDDGRENVDRLERRQQRPSDRSSDNNNDESNKPLTWHGKAWKHFNNERSKVGSFVNDERVQMFIIVLIAINAVMMGVATFDFITDHPDREEAFETVDLVFLVIFTVELGMQLFYHGLRLFLDGWLVFDFFIILLSWAFSSAQIIRAFRIFRALRLITRIRVMKNLVQALFSVVPRMAAIAMLLLLIFYIFAVMFTQLFKDMYHDGETEIDYFSRLDGTFFTLFQIMTLDNWSDAARDVMDTYKWAWLPFVAFVIVSGFVVVNLIIAVICDAISALHTIDKAKLHGRTYSEDEGNSNNINSSSSSNNNVTGGGDNSASRGGQRRSSSKGSKSRSGEGGGGGGVAFDMQDPLDTEAAQRQREIDIREQIRSLETQVEQLSRMQEQTMYTIEYLNRHLQMKRAGKGLGEDSTVASLSRATTRRLERVWSGDALSMGSTASLFHTEAQSSREQGTEVFPGS